MFFLTNLASSCMRMIIHDTPRHEYVPAASCERTEGGGRGENSRSRLLTRVNLCRFGKKPTYDVNKRGADCCTTPPRRVGRLECACRAQYLPVYWCLLDTDPDHDAELWVGSRITSKTFWEIMSEVQVQSIPSIALPGAYAIYAPSISLCTKS